VRIEQAMALLEERGRGGVPQNVAYTLREWARGYIEIQIAPVLLLQVSSDVAADALCRSTKFRGFGLRKLAPGVIVAHSHANLLELRRLLRQEGVMVRIGTFPALEECGARTEGADPS
jgi:hypothetical protein